MDQLARTDIEAFWIIPGGLFGLLIKNRNSAWRFSPQDLPDEGEGGANFTPVQVVFFGPLRVWAPDGWTDEQLAAGLSAVLDDQARPSPETYLSLSLKALAAFQSQTVITSPCKKLVKEQIKRLRKIPQYLPERRDECKKAIEGWKALLQPKATDEQVR